MEFKKQDMYKKLTLKRGNDMPIKPPKEEKEFYESKSKEWLVERLLSYSEDINRFDKELQTCRKRLKKRK